MTSATEVPERDLRLVLDIVQAGHTDDSGEAMPWSVLDGIARLVGGAVSFSQQDYQRGVQFSSQGVVDGERCFETTDSRGPDEELFWSLFWESYCSYPQRTGDLATVFHEEDFGTVADRLRQPMWVDNFWPNGVHHCMCVSLPAPPGQARRLVLQRDAGPGYTERDRQLLSLLRPHLYEIWLTAERKRAGVPRLTHREWEVLRLAGEGHSNAEIGRRLFVSQGTVRKHMEHIMDRLDVHTRAAAAAIALPRAPMGLACRQPALVGTARADMGTA